MTAAELPQDRDPDWDGIGRATCDICGAAATQQEAIAGEWLVFRVFADEYPPAFLCSRCATPENVFATGFKQRFSPRRELSLPPGAIASRSSGSYRLGAWRCTFDWGVEDGGEYVEFDQFPSDADVDRMRVYASGRRETVPSCNSRSSPQIRP